jgi:hypothetical protein
VSDACIERHERARRDSNVFATFIQLEPWDLGIDRDGKPRVLRIANCPECKTTVARAVEP